MYEMMETRYRAKYNESTQCFVPVESVAGTSFSAASEDCNYRNGLLDEGELIVNVCPQCKQPFMMGSDEAAWFTERGLHVPKRCKPCRENNREKRAIMAVRPVGQALDKAERLKQILQEGL